MNRDGALQLDLVDVYGDHVPEKVDIYLRHQTLAAEQRVARGIDASKSILIKQLLGTPQGLYRIEVHAPSYLPTSWFVNVKSSGVTSRVKTLLVDARKVVRVDFPPFERLPYGREFLERCSNVLGFEGRSGASLYNSLDDIRRAGLLNILAKCHHTRLAEGGTVLCHLRELRELRGDRFYATVSHALRESVRNSVADGSFFPVDGLLHRPPDGYSLAGSFKTSDSYGNLQLTFFCNGVDWVADIDIDDAGGFEHAFQVIRNAVTGQPTHPYNIHQILIYWQELDPGYRLILYEEEPQAAITGG
ncbi:MAG: hypothetical protein IRZ15_01550 [Bryobacteraceae bacterium]|nr:hypothetical protein [Bryobacteraceae bacterium]